MNQAAAQQDADPARQTVAMGCLIVLLMLVLATMLAGPVGFLLAAVLILAWAVVSGSLRLLGAVLSLPLRALEAVLRHR